MPPPSRFSSLCSTSRHPVSQSQTQISSTTVMAGTSQPLHTYRGNCHCGLFVYEADIPTITTLTDCNCSLCSKRGYLWVLISSPEKVRVVKGDENALTSYSFGSTPTHHKFCPRCGTGVLSRKLTGLTDSTVAINVSF